MIIIALEAMPRQMLTTGYGLIALLTTADCHTIPFACVQ